jgi:hypothetical protein
MSVVTPSSSTVNPAATTTSFSTAATTTSLSIGGLSVQVRATANATVDRIAVHSKTARANMSENDRVKLFNSATQRMPSGHFTALPLEISDPKQLTEFHNIDSTIQSFRETCQNHDFLDVFSIVTPTSSGGLLTDASGARVITADLLQEYTSISIAAVAQSNRWYHEFTDNTTDQFHTNLQWSYHFLKNNIDPGLLSSLQQSHDKFDPKERGGPLLFALLMQELLFTSESSVIALKEQLRSYKINTVAGENIKFVSAVILSVCRRIWYSKAKRFPDRFVDSILSVYQTTSVPDFNAHFNDLSRQRTSNLATIRVAALSGIAPVASSTTVPLNNDLQTVEYLLSLAQTLYDTYFANGTWNRHVKQTISPDAAALSAGSFTPTCFNCGANHSVSTCPKPKDDARITAARQSYFDNKRKARNSPAKPPDGSVPRNPSSSAGQSTPTKWRSPGPNEDPFRFIWTRPLGTQPYRWDTQSNRWELMGQPEAASSSSSTLAPTPSPSTGAPAANVAQPPSTPTPSSDSDVRAQVAELHRALQALNDRL